MIADHDGLARRMMSAALHQADRVAAVHTAADAPHALELARDYRPAVAIIDLALAPHDSLQLITKMQRLTPETRIVTVSVDDPQMAIAALRAGAAGHIYKDVDPDRFATLVLRAADGEAIVPQRVLIPLLELLRGIPDAGWRPLQSRLTTREWEIIELLSAGASTHTIAERLTVSPTTVYSHVKSILRKLGVHTRRDAVLAAERLRKEEVSAPPRPHHTPPSRPV